MLDSLPMAIAIALSPFPLIPAILLLFTGRPRATASSFLCGWALGVAAVTGVAIALADVLDVFDAEPRWAAWARLVLGVLLVGYGVRQWLTRGGEADLPAWMQSLQDATPRRAVGLGLLLSAPNPKITLLALAGGLAIGSAGTTLAAEALALAAFTVVASMTVAAPLAAYVVAGERALAPLRRVRDWLQRNNDAVMAVVLTVIGVLLVVKGVQGL